MTLRDNSTIMTLFRVPRSITAAMPTLQDDRFDRSVVYVCAHSDEGAMGLILNQNLDVLTFPDLLEQLNIEPGPHCKDITVHFGGPVDEGRGFVLHSADYHLSSSMEVDETFTLTANVDILRDIADGTGPRRYLMALGYAGWSPTQLEDEIRANYWLTVPPDEALVFRTKREDMWTKALAKLGIDPSMLATEGGSA